MNKEINELLTKIFKLEDFLGHKIPNFGNIYFDWHEANRDDAQLKVNVNSGIVFVESWIVSHHNGDPVILKVLNLV